MGWEKKHQEGEPAMSEYKPDELRVAVLAGGISDEREISFSSGKNVMAALAEAGYTHVEMLDPADDDFLVKLSEGSYDVAFIALHGRGGEDGMIQSILEYLGIPYTGSGVIASACAADKDVAKAIYQRAGIPTARGVTIKRDDDVCIADIVDEVGSECFVKPAVNGSSYGVTYVKDESELLDALETAFECDEKALVEERLVGTEITVGVLGDPPRALPIVEILPQEGSEFYDLDVKYIDPTLVHRIPAAISPKDYHRAEEYAVAAHEVLGCKGFSRSDFIVGEHGTTILETNTIPGMTDTSLFPDEARHAGMPFSAVCDELIHIALEGAEE